MKRIDISQWERAAAYRLFSTYNDPCFSMTAPVSLDNLPELCKHASIPFSAVCFYAALKTIYKIKEFRMRISDVGEPIYFDEVDGGSTYLLEDQSLGFYYFPMKDGLGDFLKEMDTRRRLASSETQDNRLDLVYFSIIPWTSFTSFKNPRRGDCRDSIPKIVFGKFEKKTDQFIIPVAVEVHHALMDGKHLGLFYQLFEEELLSTRLYF